MQKIFVVLEKIARFFCYNVGENFFEEVHRTAMTEKIFAALNFIRTTIIYIIYPPLCPLCQEIVDDRNEICDDCAKKIFRLDEEKFLPESLDGVFHITKYREGTRDLLRKLKFDNNVKVLPTIKKILEKISDNPELKNFLSEIDAATFVPLHQDRLKERGFNQTELIFKNFLAEKNLPIKNFLIRQKSTPRLFKFTPAERKKILQDAFAAVEGIILQRKKILIVDDIYTTGATTSECARVLKNFGAEKVFVLAFASDSEEKINGG